MLVLHYCSCQPMMTKSWWRHRHHFDDITSDEAADVCSPCWCSYARQQVLF